MAVSSKIEVHTLSFEVGSIFFYLTSKKLHFQFDLYACSYVCLCAFNSRLDERILMRFFSIVFFRLMIRFWGYYQT